jgi:hypothetical protein
MCTDAGSFPAGQGLWIVPSRGVHTFAMRFPIDVIYLDSRQNCGSPGRKPETVALCSSAVEGNVGAGIALPYVEFHPNRHRRQIESALGQAAKSDDAPNFLVEWPVPVGRVPDCHWSGDGQVRPSAWPARPRLACFRGGGFYYPGV